MLKWPKGHSILLKLCFQGVMQKGKKKFPGGTENCWYFRKAILSYSVSLAPRHSHMTKFWPKDLP